jgi:hypothetical protein
MADAAMTPRLKELTAQRLNSLAVDGLMERLDRLTFDSLTADSRRLNGLTL